MSEEIICPENEDRRTINKLILERIDEIKNTTDKTSESQDQLRKEIAPFLEKITKHETELGFYRLFIPIFVTSFIGLVIAYINSLFRK